MAINQSPSAAASLSSPEELNTNNTQYEVWKESVRMDSIMLTNHTHHWVSDSTGEFSR